MTLRQIQRAILTLLCAASMATAGADDGAPQGKGRLTIRGTVLLPSGLPAGGAMVSVLEWNIDEPRTIKCDQSGSFEIRGDFYNGLKLRAFTADETLQGSLQIPAILSRTALALPVKVKLALARQFSVRVTSAGKPALDCEVALAGDVCQLHKITDGKGEAKFLVPLDARFRRLAAWHSQLGAAGTTELSAELGKSAELALVPPRPHTIRVLDDRQHAVEGLKLGLDIALEGPEDNYSWIPADVVGRAHVVTDATGQAIVPWFPGEKVKHAYPNVRSALWKMDQLDRDQVAEGITTVHVRRTVLVKGKLNMPGGTSAEGIMISGFGFGFGSTGHVPVARAAADGSFEMQVAPNHGYALQILDSYWGSEGWTGMVLADERAKPAEITLDPYLATPVDLRVTRGPEHQPVAGAYVYLRSDRQFSWTDAEGKKRRAQAGNGGWVWTDAKGELHLGVGRGKHSFRLSAGNWEETKTLEVKNGEKQIVDFYRPWLTRRELPGRLMLSGAPRKSAPTMIVSAGTRGRDSETISLKPEIRADGTFIVKIDAPDVAVVALDSKERLSGFARAGSSAETIDVALAPAASFSGVVVDTSGKPLDGATLELIVEGTRLPAADKQITDAQGRFRFDTVATQVPVTLQVMKTSGGPVVHRDRTRFFQPEEVREKTRIVVAIGNSPAAEANVKSLAERVQYMTGNARLAGMRGLVVLQGDSSEKVSKLTEQLQDNEEVPEVLGFLPMVVSEKALMSEGATLKVLGWQLPKPGEIVLIALDGSQKQIASERIVARSGDEAFKLGTAFLKQHAPAPRDAQVLLTAAQDEAKRTGRRVWVVEGGPRCGPCFKLARWMEEQRALLDKDYVIAKVSGMDKSIGEVMKLIGQPEGKGIPWMAITEPGGAVLVSSDGPLGNIGFPGTIEGTRHLREMLQRTARKLTAREQDLLAESLAQPEL